MVCHWVKARIEWLPVELPMEKHMVDGGIFVVWQANRRFRLQKTEKERERE